MSAVNVNLRRCDMPATCAANGGQHVQPCAGAPLLIPCPLPPTVTFRVVLGECSAFCSNNLSSGGMEHRHGCPARPISVSCTISGETWAESEVVDVKVYPRETLVTVSTYHMPRILAACRARWAIIKALVMGKWAAPAPLEYASDNVAALFRQRDAVFSALAEMARAEEAIEAAKVAAFKAFMAGETIVLTVRPSRSVLETFVDHLINQVGSLS